MPNPWLSVPLPDYEGHMSSPAVRQLPLLAELFQRVLVLCRPESVAVLGVAGGNGLEQIDTAITTRVVGVDINQQYLDEVQKRFSSLPGLELHCCDLAQQRCTMAPVALVHAALLFEHAETGLTLENALSLIAPSGRLSVVLQLPSKEESGVAATPYASMQTLKQDFRLLDPVAFQHLLQQHGLELLTQEQRSLPAGKAFWLGVFASSDRPR